MNPDKLFDYLDGKLAPADREQLEQKLMADPQLRRQFEVAREIHRSGRDNREVVVSPADPATAERAGRVGRRIATAAIVLVALNVAGGLAVIGWKSKKSSTDRTHEAGIRKQLELSLGVAGNKALPPPTFVEDRIQIAAPPSEWDAVAVKIADAAEKCGGSAARGLPDEGHLIVMADVPSVRAQEFRTLLVPATSAAASPDPTIASSTSNERTIVQVRIAEVGR